MVFLHGLVELFELVELLEEHAFQAVETVFERVLNLVDGFTELPVNIVLEVDEKFNVDLSRLLAANETFPDGALPQHSGWAVAYKAQTVPHRVSIVEF